MRWHHETDEWSGGASSECNMGHTRPPWCPATPAAPLIQGPGIRTGAPGAGCAAISPCVRHGVLGGILALRAHCALLLDYVTPDEPPGTPLGNALGIR